MFKMQFHMTDNIMIALAVTIFTELIVIVLLPKRTARLILLSIFVNIVTNISFNVGITYIPHEYDNLIVFGLEEVIVFVEALIYFVLIKDFRRSFVISLLCNLTSYLVGLALIPYIY